MSTERSEETAQSPQPRRTVSEVARTLVLTSPDADVVGRPIVLEAHAGGVDIGRTGHVGGPLAIDDQEVSRKHARIEPIDDGWQILDLGSRNGVFVRGTRVQSSELQSGDVVRIGATLLLFQSIFVRPEEPLEPQEGTILGKSVPIQRVRASLNAVAPQGIPVLISGETGVGKELVARAIHEKSGRRGAFVAVNCGGLAADVAVGEFFGHTAGAFTGADRDREGLFAAAEGGTLFLDEIGELPAPLQPVLLRVLATGELRPVGGATSRSVNVRVVAATNRDLEDDVRGGSFRPDLYARLAGWNIAVPPLRLRRDDIATLVSRFLADAGSRSRISVDAHEALVCYDWPYNIRELEQAIHAAATRSAGAATIDLEHLPAPVRKTVESRLPAGEEAPAIPPLILRIRNHGTPSASDLNAVLSHFSGNVGQAAAFFGKDRKQIYRWAKQFQIDLESFRGG